MRQGKPSPESLNSGRELIQKLHQLFCKLLPAHLVCLNMHREYQWYQWLQYRKDQPFQEQDLRDVIGYRKKLISQNRQFEACLKFHNLIGGPDEFEEDLAQAQAMRKRVGGDRESVLRSSGRPTETTNPVRVAADFVPAALAKLKASIQP